jgi:hypothetical protein
VNVEWVGGTALRNLRLEPGSDADEGFDLRVSSSLITSKKKLLFLRKLPATLLTFPSFGSSTLHNIPWQSTSSTCDKRQLDGFDWLPELQPQIATQAQAYPQAKHVLNFVAPITGC